MLQDHFKLLPFLAGIAAGIVLLIFFKPEPVVLYKYPHPQNIDNRSYKDKNGICYKYTSKTVNCDENEDNIKPYPIQ
jgi:hypothetical protein